MIGGQKSFEDLLAEQEALELYKSLKARVEELEASFVPGKAASLREDAQAFRRDWAECWNRSNGRQQRDLERLRTRVAQMLRADQVALENSR